MAAALLSFSHAVSQRRPRETTARTLTKGCIPAGSPILYKTRLQTHMVPGSQIGRARETEDWWSSVT